MINYGNIDEIVLIDDDPIQHLICKRMLKLVYTFHIKDFYNGLEAICYLKDRNPDPSRDSKTLIFLDLNMPVMDGFEFLEKHRCIDKEITANDHLVVLSSSILRSNKLMVIDFSELKGYYEKPLTRELLEKVFESIITR